MTEDIPVQNELTDSSGDRRYFVITPQIVWGLCRDVYDLALWHTIKMIAGEDGECYLSTQALATLSMMSAGKASECRSYLLSAGLIVGEVRRDPGYPQPVWHLAIPDLWRRNLAWRDGIGDKLMDRVRLKEAQRIALQNGATSLHLVKPSPREQGTTPGEEGITPREQGTTPGETKKIQSENQRERPTPTTTAGIGVADLRSSPEFSALREAFLLIGGIPHHGVIEDLREQFEADPQRLWALLEHAKRSDLGNRAGLFVKLVRDGVTAEEVNHRQVIVIDNRRPAQQHETVAKALEPDQVVDPDEFFDSFHNEAAEESPADAARKAGWRIPG